MKSIRKFLSLILLAGWLFSEELVAQLDRQRAATDDAVELTFMAPRNINLYTVEPLSKGELHYSIMHTFGEVDSGAGSLWGIDDGANVRFSFEYGFGESFTLGFGRSSMDKVVDFSARIALFRQKREGGSPISMSVIPSAGITTASFGFLNEDYSFTDRLNFSLSVPIARKLNDALSLQLTPILATFNRVGPELNIADPTVNTYYTIAAGGRFKIKPRTALSFQYVPPLTSAENLDANIAVGIDIETGGHVFQMFFTTSRALNESYIVASENGNFFDREFRFGFNVNRLFRVR